MTLEERNVLLNSPSFNAQVRIALCDWMNYWVTAGTDSIEDETVKNNTDAFIRELIENLDECTAKVVVLAISDTNIINAEGTPTDQNVKQAVDSITAHCLPYLM